jgi:uncharacterized protein YecE (DUF72 family)
MSTVQVGTSGWSYPKGKGTWNGIFYPVAGERTRAGHANAAGHGPAASERAGASGRLRALGASASFADMATEAAGAKSPKSRFDELAFYAQHFDTVEVNSTFYRVPAVDAVRSWGQRTPAGFEFALKLYQKFTHPEMFAKATGADPTELGQQDVDEFRAAIEPLASAGKLGPILAQFPASFRNEPNSRGYLEWLLEAFRDYRVAVELRHRSFSDDPLDTQKLLAEHGAAWVQIDEPKFRFSIRQNRLPNVPTFYYMRLHGRNAANWWSHEQSEDRYDYLYSPDELKPIVEAAEHAGREVKKSYVYTNNHFSAKSVANAVEIKAQLGQPIPGEYPEEFVERYPDLKGLVKILRKSQP